MSEYTLDIKEMYNLMRCVCDAIDESKRIVKISHNKLQEFIGSFGDLSIKEMLQIAFSRCEHELVLSKDFPLEYDTLFEIEWNERMDDLKKEIIKCSNILDKFKTNLEIALAEKKDFLYEFPEESSVCISSEYLSSNPILKYNPDGDGVMIFISAHDLSHKDIPNVIHVYNTVIWETLVAFCCF